MCTECILCIMVFAIDLDTGIHAELVDSQLVSTDITKIIIVSGSNRSNSHVQLYFYCTLKPDMISHEQNNSVAVFSLRLVVMTACQSNIEIL